MMDLKESNKLIADFMGHKSDWPEMWRTQFTSPLTFENLQYNTSWDWLMPVIDKIENNIFGFVKIFGHNCEIDDMINHNYPDDRYIYTEHHAMENSSKIESTYKAVVDFIIEFNENKFRYNYRF